MARALVRKAFRKLPARVLRGQAEQTSCQGAVSGPARGGSADVMHGVWVQVTQARSQLDKKKADMASLESQVQQAAARADELEAEARRARYAHLPLNRSLGCGSPLSGQKSLRDRPGAPS